MSDTLESQLRAVQSSRRAAEDEGAEQRYLESSRKRLLKIVSKKNVTSFIGAIAKFEQFFGAVWGHGVPDDQKTPEQLAWAAAWEQARTEILNNGNNQLRAVENEFAQYTVRWNRYSTVLPAAQGRPGVSSVSQ